MRMPTLGNLKDLMIGITDLKKNLADIIKENKTKVIIRNNEPVSILMPYDEFVSNQQGIRVAGEEFELSNGVKVKVLVEEVNGCIETKTYIKMKSSEEYKLHFNHAMSNPSVEQTLTTEELVQHYSLK